MKKTKSVLLLAFLLCFSLAKAQEDSTSIKVGKLYLAPLPVISANPAFGIIYGAAASASIYMGEPTNTNMSNAVITATYSTKKQLMFTLKSNVYSSNNDWFLIGDWRVFFSSQPTYGLGTGPQSEIMLTDDGFELGDYKDGVSPGELMDFNLIRFHQTALKQVLPDFFLGVGYHLDVHFNIVDNLLDLEADPPMITNHYAYSTLHGFDPEGYTTSGISANVVYDTRDNVANPYSGRYAFIAFRGNPEFLGSDQSSTSLWMEYRDYINLSKEYPRHLIAVWTYLNLTTSGTLPYMSLPAMGWDQMGRSGRAYPQGRWRGNDLFYAEVEYRVPIPVIPRNRDLLGAVVFANVTSASADDLDVGLFDYMKPAAGLGLRIMIQKQSRTNLTIDYGWGADGEAAFYLNLNETF